MKNILLSASVLVLPLSVLAGGYGAADPVTTTADSALVSPASTAADSEKVYAPYVRISPASGRPGSSSTGIIRYSTNDDAFRTSETFESDEFGSDLSREKARADAARAKLLRLRNIGR